MNSGVDVWPGDDLGMWLPLRTEVTEHLEQPNWQPSNGARIHGTACGQRRKYTDFELFAPK